MMNDERRAVEGGMLSKGSRRWRGNEAGMRVISVREVRNRPGGVEVCMCVLYLLRQVGEDLGADSVQSLHDLSLRRERILCKDKDKTTGGPQPRHEQATAVK